MKAIVTGGNGQDASYLCELLLKKNIEVCAVVRRSSTNNLERINHIIKHIKVYEADVTDYSSLLAVGKYFQPDYLFNTAAQSHVYSSFIQPIYTTNSVYLGCLNCLELIKNEFPDCRMYQCSSSEMFGDSVNSDGSQNESTPFNPRSPYGIAKLAAHHLVDVYRKSYKVFAVSGILFNHSSPRRGDLFVEKKIVNWAKKCSKDGMTNIYLGNLDAHRDFGFAGDYVKAIWLMLQNTIPKDYVVSTGKTHSIRNILEVFENRLPNMWDFVKTDSSLLRPCEVPYLRGDSSLIQKELGWKPEVSFKQLIEDMYDKS